MGKAKRKGRKRPVGTTAMFACVSNEAYVMLQEAVRGDVKGRRAGDRRPTLASVLERCIVETLAPAPKKSSRLQVPE